MSRNKKTLICLIITALSIVVVAIMFSAASGGEENYKYAWNEEYKTAVDTCTWIGWVFVVLAVANFIEGIVYGLSEESHPEESENDAEAQIITGAVRCESCNDLLSRNAVKCDHCGTPVAKQISDAGTITTNLKPVSIVKPTGNCLICGAVMAEDQTFCGACGRRQD